MYYYLLMLPTERERPDSKGERLAAEERGQTAEERGQTTEERGQQQTRGQTA
jgi:hypothetical protein